MPIRVALADDSDVILRTLGRFLREQSSLDVVGVASTVQEALKLLQKFNPDVLVFDLHMTVLPKDCCADLLAVSEKYGMVAISMSDDEEGRAIAARCGAACLVSKINLSEDLIPAIMMCAKSSGKAAD